MATIKGTFKTKSGDALYPKTSADNVTGLATVATTGSYSDLSNKPTIPTVNNATLTIQKNGSTVKTFTANASSDVTANISVPTKVSELTNDKAFLKGSDENLLCVGPTFSPSDANIYCANQTITIPSGRSIGWKGLFATVTLPAGTYTMCLYTDAPNLSYNLGRVQVNDSSSGEDQGTKYVNLTLTGSKGIFSEPSVFALSATTKLYVRYCFDCTGTGNGVASGSTTYAQNVKIAIFRGNYSTKPDFVPYGRDSIFDAIYPVGSIYISTKAVSPATWFGGTWERIDGRFLWANSNDAQLATGASGNTGGESSHTLTVNEMPAHKHSFKSQAFNAGSAGPFYGVWTGGTLENLDDHIYNQGGGQAHNNMPPYLSVAMWKRIA